MLYQMEFAVFLGITAIMTVFKVRMFSNDDSKVMAAFDVIYTIVLMVLLGIRHDAFVTAATLLPFVEIVHQAATQWRQYGNRPVLAAVVAMLWCLGTWAWLLGEWAILPHLA